MTRTVTVLRLVGLVAVGVVLIVSSLAVSRKIDGWFGGNADAATTAASKNQVKLHASQVKIRAHLYAVELHDKAMALSVLALSDALRDSAPPATTAGELAWKRIADLTRTSAAACFQAQAACEQRAASAEQEAATLTAQLHAQIGVKDHPCGLFIGLGGTVGVGAAGVPGNLVTGGAVAAGFTIMAGCRIIRSPWP